MLGWISRRDCWFFYGKAQVQPHDQAYLRHWRRRLVPRQGHHGCLAGAPSQVARLQGHDAEGRSLPQRRPGHHEPVPARRGLRHRGRLRERPRPRPLRALHRREPHPQLQLHHRCHLPEPHRPRAPRRLPRRHGAGHPARHQRHQGALPPHRGADRRRRGDHRAGRHHRRHREPAVPRGHAPVPPRQGLARRVLHPRVARALHRCRPRGQDQAHAALREGAARPRHPARLHRLPLRPRGGGVHPRQDCELLRRRRRPRLRELRLPLDLRRAQASRRSGLRPQSLRAPRPRPAHERHERVVRLHRPHARSQRQGRRDQHRRGGQVHAAPRRLPLRHRGAPPLGRGLWPPRQHRARRRREPRRVRRRAGPGPRRRHPGAGRLWHPRPGGQDSGRPPRPHQEGAVPRHLPGPAGRRVRVRPQRRRHARRQLHRVRARLRVSGDRPHARPRGRHRQGRHHAPRCLSLQGGRRHAGP